MRTLKVVGIGLAIVLVVALAFIYSGVFNVAADEPHWTVTHRLIESTRERSIAMRSRDVRVPPSLDEPALIAAGAGEYAEMCTGCHLAPGMRESELRTGLYPKPPNLAELDARRPPAEMFWIIKHGLKMTGMPAWGPTHDDHRIWSMVAFLRKLPQLSPAAYRELAGSGGDHSHGEMASEEEREAAHSHGETNEEPARTEQQGGHEHGDGEGHEHPKPPAAPLAASTVEPIAVVDRFLRALSVGDTKGASAVLDPGVLIYESGGAERSRSEYAAHHLGKDAAFMKSAQHRLVARSGDAVGDLAWVATEARLTGTSQGKPVDVLTTETMVLRKSAEGWRIVHIHWSNQPAKGAA